MRCLLLALVIALMLPSAAPAASNPWLAKRVLNIAHQGGEDEFPSNTLYAFKRSVRAGADMLELDVGATLDGNVVVSHDTTLDRVTNGRGTIASHTLAQIRKLDGAYWFHPGDDAYRHNLKKSAYRLRGIATGRRKPPHGYKRADFRVATLAEVMKAFPRIPINVEIKGRTKAEAEAEYAHRSGYAWHTWLSDDGESPGTWTQLIDWCVDGVMTARPVAFEKVLRSHPAPVTCG